MGSTQKAKERLFSVLPSTITFVFDLILGSFLAFLGPHGLFCKSPLASKTVLGSTHVDEQLLFSIFPLIMNFDFDLIFGSVFHFLTSNG